MHISKQRKQAMISSDSTVTKIGETTMTQKIKLKQLRGVLMSSLVLAGAYVAASVLSADYAHAATGGLDVMISGLQTAVSGAAKLVYTGLYAGDVAVGGAGLYSLKRHADNPGQESMQKGLTRVAVGAGLIALPTLVGQVLTSTSGTTDTGSLTGGVINP